MLKTAGITFGSRLLGALLSFLLVVLVSRWLGAEARGVCGLYLVVVALVTAVGDIAGGAAAPFLLNRFGAHQLFKGQMAWALLPSVAVPLFFLFFYRLEITETLWLMAACWINCTWSVLQQLLLGLKKFLLFNLLTISLPALSLSFFVCFYYTGLQGPLYYLVSLAAAGSVQVLLGCLALGKPLFQPIGRERLFQPGIFRQGFMNQLSHLASLLNSRMVFFILPAAGLGLWANTLTLCEAFFMVPGSLGQVAYGLMATQPDGQQKVQVFRKAWLANIIAAVPCLLLFIWLPDAFWMEIFGPSFSGISALLGKVAPGIGLYSFYLLASYWQSASGNFRYNLYALVAGLAANFGLTAVLLLSGHYSLGGGIMALVAGWVMASVAGFRTLYLANKEAFKHLF